MTTTSRLSIFSFTETSPAEPAAASSAASSSPCVSSNTNGRLDDQAFMLASCAASQVEYSLPPTPGPRRSAFLTDDEKTLYRHLRARPPLRPTAKYALCATLSMTHGAVARSAISSPARNASSATPKNVAGPRTPLSRSLSLVCTAGDVWFQCPPSNHLYFP